MGARRAGRAWYAAKGMTKRGGLWRRPGFARLESRDTLAVKAIVEAARMILIECPWCEAELAVETLDEASVDCPDCRITVDFAPEPAPIAVAA